VIPLEHIDLLRQANPQYNFEETAEELYDLALRNRDADLEIDTANNILEQGNE
jgi:hypothetical protein